MKPLDAGSLIANRRYRISNSFVPISRTCSTDMACYTANSCSYACTSHQLAVPKLSSHVHMDHGWRPWAQRQCMRGYICDEPWDKIVYMYQLWRAHCSASFGFISFGRTTKEVSITAPHAPKHRGGER